MAALLREPVSREPSPDLIVQVMVRSPWAQDPEVEFRCIEEFVSSDCQ